MLYGTLPTSAVEFAQKSLISANFCNIVSFTHLRKQRLFPGRRKTTHTLGFEVDFALRRHSERDHLHSQQRNPSEVPTLSTKKFE